MKKILLIGIIILAVLAFAGYKFMYKDHRDIASEDATFTITPAELKKAFTDNDSLANSKYADQTIQVAGKVSAADSATKIIVLDQMLSATLAGNELPAVGTTVTIKGRFVGYDDLVEELKMDQVSLIK